MFKSGLKKMLFLLMISLTLFVFIEPEVTNSNTAEANLLTEAKDKLFGGGEPLPEATQGAFGLPKDIYKHGVVRAIRSRYTAQSKGARMFANIFHNTVGDGGTIENTAAKKKEMENIEIDEKEFESAWEALFVEYKTIIEGIIGVGLITSVIIMGIHLLKFAGSGGNPMERRESIRDMAISGVCIALLGGVLAIYSVLYASLSV